MGQVLAFLVVAVGFAAILAALAALRTFVRRHNRGGGLMAPLEEIFHPAAHRFRQEIAIHEQRMLPVAPAEDQRRPRRKRA